jgi:hypothetical protein
MGLLDRPYGITWKPNRTVVRHTPDAIVYINGSPSLQSCASCNNKVDLQKYITAVTVSPSTDPIATASINLVVPQSSSDVFGYDGNWVLQPGLEVVVVMRGYFPQTGLLEDTDENEAANNVAMYPYYQVFHGVVTNANHDFSGGFYTASLSCSDLLHFWSTLYISTNGQVFGNNVDNSGVYPELRGHTLVKMSPYSIVYTLVRVGFGAAYLPEFKLEKVDSNADAGQSYRHAAEYWAARWSQNAGNLRMYGVDGNVYTAHEQAYLGLFQAGNDSAKKIIQSLGQKINQNTFNLENSEFFQQKMRELGYDVTSTRVSTYVNDEGKEATVDVLNQLAFARDLSQEGNVNLFNTEYMTKLDIVNAVIDVTGFEFYQDVDGDLVFKPPFFNLDTSDDPVFVVEDRDLISITEASGEPEATLIKGSASVFENVKTGIGDGFEGRGANYIDYRLVAQYGWKEGASFETTYLTDPRGVYLSCIARLDIANMNMNTADIMVPLRPELRPGYPIYVRCVDSYFYIKSLSHSFSYGGECTTNISGVSRRRKWLPPVKTPLGGAWPSLSDIRLDKPGELPPQPIIVEPSNVTDEGGKPALSGPPRMIGFPNVILALDADQVETANLPFSEFTPSMADSVIESALKVGSLRKTDEKDKFLLPSDSSGGGLILTRNELRAAFTSIRNQLLGSSNQPSTTQASTSTSTPTATPKEASFKAADPLPSDREAFSKIDALVENGKVTSGFGQRWGKAHKGIDIAAPPGSRVNAAYDGSVRYVGTEKGGITVGYGLFVILDHGKGVTTLYGHLKEGSPLVKKGDKVKQGQQIAGVGNTGHSTGPHLHYEYRLNGKSVNPVEVG